MTIVQLRDAAAAGQAVAGGKATRLGELLGHGFDVPPGFVVGTSAFVDHLTSAGAGLLLEGEFPTPEYLARIAGQAFDVELGRLVLDAFDALAGDGARQFVCAVRSSAADEDGTAASFAGQHATYYYTRRDEVLQRIVDCWISAFTPEARAYRRQLGIFASPRMAVIVQQMVPADVSGVAFTRDPTGRHADSMIIESTWGLGAALVDGRVSPDAYRVARATKDIESVRIGTKRQKVAEALLDPKGSRLEPVPRHLQARATLDDAKVAEVATLALACETMFGAPQDVEWAIVDHRLYLLQSRPVTRIAPTARPVEGRFIAFKPVLENSTAPFTPLTVDLLRSVIGPLFRFIDGRLYLDFDMAMMGLPIRRDERALADALLLRRPTFDLALEKRRIGLAFGLAVVGYLSFGTLFARTRKLPSAAFADFGALCERLLADDSIDVPASIKAMVVPRSPFAPIGEQAMLANIASVRYFMLLGVLEGMLANVEPPLDARTIAALTSGPDEMISRDMLRDLEALARIASERPAVKRLIMADRFDELPHQLAAHPEAGAFVEALASFMSRYGHRGTREIELASPRWREDPTPLFAMVRNILKDSRAEAPPRATAAERRGTALAEIDARIGSRTKRALIRYVSRRIAYYASLRENTRHWHALGFATARAKIQAIEQQLIADGQLKCADDIYFLLWPEIVDLRAGRIAWRHVEDRIRRRRIRHQRRARQRPPLAFNMEVDEGAPGNLRLAGQCASPGLAEGTARVITDPAIDGVLAPGDVLVAPFTDPTWTPLFLNASAVVVETGSYLSHAGTIARELGIPCLVDVSGVMDIIADGARVKVDATAGNVLLLDSPGGAG